MYAAAISVVNLDQNIETYHSIHECEAIMLASIVADFFKYKVVQSVIVLACWSPTDQLRFIRQLSLRGVSATFACDVSILNHVHQCRVEGVLYFHHNDSLLEKVNKNHFKNHYKWLLVGESLPEVVHGVRYDAEMTFVWVDQMQIKNGNLVIEVNGTETNQLEDIHIHPSEGASLHPWAYWSEASGLVVTQDRARILRKMDLKGYPLRIAAPLGFYSEDWYNGTYKEYIRNETLNELDSALRCGYLASMLVIEAMNATDELLLVQLWATMENNSSMILQLSYGEADLSGGILRLLEFRMDFVDFIMPLWPFRVGFSYLAERESSSNMFVEPFTAGVWFCCLAIGMVLAIAQRVSSRSQMEKEGSYYAVLAIWLQQGSRIIQRYASAVPNGISGRWTFIVTSICSMLVYAYYTSAIVSALMSSGGSGPDSLRSLADSKYAIASEDYDYMRYVLFDIHTTWDDLEYLKRKKMTSSFYQELERGVDLIQEGNTAFHTEFNQIFPHFKRFTDDQICKLQFVDTIPKVMTWMTGTGSGQWTIFFRSVSMWIQETGLTNRLRSRLLARQPACRSALLAERVSFGDVAYLMALSASGGILSLILLGLEIFYARSKKSRHNLSATSNSPQM